MTTTLNTVPLFIRLAALSVLLFSANGYAAIQTTSSVATVTVYPDSARVTRTATVHIPAGESTLHVTDLPIRLDKNSLRVSGSSQGETGANVVLGSVQLAERITTDVIQEREQQLKQEISNWQQKRQSVVDAKSRAEQQLAFIRATGLQSATDTPDSRPQNPSTRLPLDQWQTAWQVLEAATADAQRKIREANQTIKDFDKGIKQLQQQLAQVATDDTRTRNATLHVKTDKATALTLTLRYQIHGARWTPVYDAELDTAKEQLTVRTQAEIQQHTGEDWQEATVTLSTLRPRSNATLPELSSWVVDIMPEHYSTIADGMQAEMAMGMAADMAAQPMQSAPMRQVMRAPAPKPMAVANSSLMSGEYNAEYRVPGALSLTSGSDSRRVTLEQHALTADVQLASAPRIDPRAILHVTSTYTGKAPLIPGRAALYRDGNFIGNTRLNELQTGEKLKLSFGEDDRVKVTFKRVPEKTKSNGLLSSRENLERHHIVEVSNHHTRQRTITLYDNLPVAGDEKIQISPTGDRPSITDVDDEKGVVAWVREVAAGNKQTITYGYTVSYPEDAAISGL